MLAPALGFGALFYGGPVLVSFWLSLTDWSPLGQPHWRGLANYVYLLGADPLFFRTLANTLAFALGSAALGIPLALLAALGITASRGRAVWRAIFWLPMVTNVVAVGTAWRYVLDPTFGIANRLLGALGLHGLGWLDDPATALPSAILVMAWLGIGHSMLLLAAGIEAIDPAVLDAARIDGAGPWQMLIRIVLPLLRPTLAFVTITSLIAGVGSFALILVLTGGGPEESTDVTALYMYRTAFEQLRMGRASAIAFMLVLLTLALAAVQWRSLRDARGQAS